LRISKEGNEVIEKLHLLSGETIETTRNVFESLITQVAINYMNNSPTVIPFIGELKVTYLKDEIKKEGKLAVLETVLIPDPTLLKVIGQIEDKDEIDIEKTLKQKVSENLGRYLE